MRLRLLCISVIVILVATTLGVSSSAAQGVVGDEADRLEAELANIESTLANAEAQKAEITARRDDARDRLGDAHDGLELDADRLAKLVSQRDPYAEQRNTVAIESFMHGDPRGSAMLAEMRDLNDDDTLTRRAELYSAVVDGAIGALNRIDEDLRVTRAEVSTLQEKQVKATADLAQARDDLEAATGSVDELAAQRAVIADRLAWLEEVAGRPVLTGREGTNPDRPVLAVKIDNVRAAWPQVGINQADVVFEEQVEGGLSRLAALFHSRIPDTVGPVRSVRTTDINLLANLDEPLFSHSGGNAVTTSLLAASSLVNVGHPAKPDMYYRDNGRRAPHNLLTSPADLLNSASGGRPPAMFHYLAPDEKLGGSARPANGVVVNFGNTGAEYRWNGKGWARTQDGNPHIDVDDRQVAPNNVVVQFVSYQQSPADANSPEAVVVGSGTAWAFVDGKVIEGSWSRGSLSEVTEFVDDNGDAMLLTPGNTWVALAPNGGGAII